MKNPYFLTLIVLFFISLQACDRQNTTKEDLMIFDIDKAGDQISFNIKNIFSSGEIVKLENNPEALLGRVTASAITENYIILYNQSGLILLFDRNGNFIRHIGQKGKGPFEYKYVNGLTVSDNEDIVLVDRALLNDFVGYSINGEGEFKVERKNQGRHMFSLFGTNEILSIGYHEHSFKGGTDSVNLYHLGSDGSIQHTNSSFRSIRQIRVGGITIPQYMYKYKDNFRVHLGQDTLYTYNVEEKVLKKTAVFTSSSLKFNYKKLNEDKERSSFNEEDILGHIFVEIYAETKDYYLLQGVKAEKYSFIY